MDAGVQTMLFDELRAVFDAIEKEIDICRGVKKLFHLSGVTADIAGGQLVVLVADVAEYFECISMVKMLYLFIEDCDEVLVDG